MKVNYNLLKQAEKLKGQLTELYANHIINELRQQGVTVDNNYKFYEQLIELLEDSISNGSLKI